MYSSKKFTSFEALAKFLNENESVELVLGNERSNMTVSTLLKENKKPEIEAKPKTTKKKVSKKNVK